MKHCFTEYQKVYIWKEVCISLSYSCVIKGFVLLIISDLTYSEIYKLRNNYVLFLSGSVGQEFGQGILGMACLCCIRPGATVTQAVRDLTVGGWIHLKAHHFHDWWHVSDVEVTERLGLQIWAVTLCSSHQGSFKIVGSGFQAQVSLWARQKIHSEFKLHHFHHSLLVDELQTHLNLRGRDIDPISQWEDGCQALIEEERVGWRGRGDIVEVIFGKFCLPQHGKEI